MGMLRGRLLRMLGVLLAAVVTLWATAGVASAEESAPPAGSVNLGVAEPTTTVSVDGGVVELIPPTSYELPPESTASTDGESTIDVQGASSEIARSPSSEMRGVSSPTGPTSSAGVSGSLSVTWLVIGALGILAAALWLARSRRAARH